MLVLVFLLQTCLQALSTAEWCASLLSQHVCDSDFFCLWDGTICDLDENAKLDSNAVSCSGSSGCTSATYNDGSYTYYITYSTVKGGFDSCNLDYYIALDFGTGPVCQTSGGLCGEIGVDTKEGPENLCVGYCIAVPDDPSCYCIHYPNDATCVCQQNPSAVGCETCSTTSGSTCCVIQQSYTCSTFCLTEDALSSYCCGNNDSPANYSTLISQACTNYFINTSRHSGSDYKSRQLCLYDPTNLTACALCNSYYSCCSQFKEKAPSAAAGICEHYCSLEINKDDEDCVHRAECIASGQSVEKCAASHVRLSSFCVAFLLAVIGFFLF